MTDHVTPDLDDGVPIVDRAEPDDADVPHDADTFDVFEALRNADADNDGDDR